LQRKALRGVPSFLSGVPHALVPKRGRPQAGAARLQQAAGNKISKQMKKPRSNHTTMADAIWINVSG